MKVKMTFPKAKLQTIKQCMENEKSKFNKMAKSVGLKILRKSFKQVHKTDFIPLFDYDFKSDTEVEILVTTGMDAFVNEKKMFEKLCKYEKVSDGEIKVELIEDE